MAGWVVLLVDQCFGVGFCIEGFEIFNAFTEPDTRTLRTPDCYPNEGYGGFDIDVFRTVTRDGEVVKDETFHTTYIPSDTVVCKPPNE